MGRTRFLQQLKMTELKIALFMMPCQATSCSGLWPIRMTLLCFLYIQPAMPNLFPLIASSLPPLTQDEIKTFHEVDRVLYSVLIFNLWRDPIESMRVMALWLWLERTMFDSVIKRILSLPHFLINEIADEATTCLNYLMNANPSDTLPEQTDFPRTQSFLSNGLTLKFFIENQGSAVLGIGKALSDVCVRALSDLMQQAVETNKARALAEAQMAMSSLFEQGLSRRNINNNFGRINQRSERRPELVHPDDRTLFVTFSKGYPVPEQDIREFFCSNYGNCIESLHMQEVPLGDQALYARIVFHKSYFIEAVLNGVEKAKYTINGRHLWMRKFVPKKKTSSSPPGRVLFRGESSSGV